MYLRAALRGESAQEATRRDIRHEYRRDFIKFPSRESDLPGRIYIAVEIAGGHGIHHMFDGVAKLVSPAVYADYVLARTFVSRPLERVDYVFNGPIKSAFQGEQLLGDQGDAQNARFQIPKLKLVFQKTDLLARVSTTLRARARTRRSSPSPNSPGRPMKVMTFKLRLTSSLK